MADIPEPNNQPSPQLHYRWPWFVLGAFLLAIVLAVLWMSREVERTRLLRDLNSPSAAAPAQETNSNQ